MIRAQRKINRGMFAQNQRQYQIQQHRPKNQDIKRWMMPP
jgi:hypothetical protein